MRTGRGTEGYGDEIRWRFEMDLEKLGWFAERVLPFLWLSAIHLCLGAMNSSGFMFGGAVRASR